MGHSVTIGGNRLGSGSKNKTYLHNYERSTHNLDTDFLSTMGCGMLIPFLNEIVTRDDKYEIDLEAGLRTIPTKGPLFGSFKLQLDVFKCPLRLYQALLHNNPMAIGLRANQVKFPKIRLYDNIPSGKTYMESRSANNSLIRYLGTSGIGTIYSPQGAELTTYRDFFGSDLLAYYDIFKNYYANKQEDYAYTLGTEPQKTEIKEEITYVNTLLWTLASGQVTQVWNTEEREVLSGKIYECTNPDKDLSQDTNYYDFFFRRKKEYETQESDLTYEDFLESEITITDWNFTSASAMSPTTKKIKEWLALGTIQNIWYDKYKTDTETGVNIQIRIKANSTNSGYTYGLYKVGWSKYFYKYEDAVILKSFALKNIDDMRYTILGFAQLGQSYILDGDDIQYGPYWDAIGDTSDYFWKKPLAGICVKTYQSDLFNNWVKTELIDGENGIADITAIATSSGSITIDQLQFSEKLYNLLNRIAISGNTYEDYLDAAYTKSHKRFEETPMWLGGMSDEIVFEEIVQTAPAEDSQLGTLGGRGNLLGRRNGGKITVHIDEPSIIMGIVSITPRIVYTQGNTWFKTEIDSLMDIHVPALDGIGFQNLMAEEMNSSAAIINASTGELQPRAVVGKIPAWLHYMTNIDRAYGDFAAEDGDGFMVLNRNYEVENGVLQDATTYIDPAKYNYAFAYTKREAQNFWVKIKAHIKARRLMSAKQIPTA